MDNLKIKGNHSIQFDKNIIFIDLSYLVFYRFFALQKWFKLANKDIEITHDFKWLKNKIFIEKFEKTLFDTIKKIAKKNKVPLNNIIFSIDCNSKNIWRHNITNKYNNDTNNDTNNDNVEFLKYKGTRSESHKKQNFTEFEIFDLVKKNYLPNFCKEYNNLILNHENAEADDCIAIYINYIKNNNIMNNPDNKLFIIASDTDYLQLCNNNIELIDLKMTNIKQKHLVKKNIESIEYLLRKILIGDTSDNINGCTIYPNKLEFLKETYNIKIRRNKKNIYKITDKIINELLNNPILKKGLYEYLELDKNDNDLQKKNEELNKLLNFINLNIFNYNQIMIDFNYIPNYINLNLNFLIL